MAFLAQRNGDFIEIPGTEEKEQDIDSAPQQIRFVGDNDQNRIIDYSAANASRAYNLLTASDNVLSVYSSNPSRGTSATTAPANSFETPKERFSRLQADFLEFKEQMEFIVAKEKEIPISTNSSNSIILSEIQRIQKEIENLVSSDDVRRILENNISSSADVSINNALGILRKDLQTDLTENLIRRLKSMTTANQSDASSSLSSSARIEVFIDPENERLRSDAKYVEIERRLAHLEKELTITSKSKHAQSDAPVLSRMEVLSNQVNILSSEKSEILLRRVADLEAQIEKISTKRTALAQQNQISPDDLKRIELLHDRFQTVAGVADELPLIVDRMEALRTLHEESAGLVNQIHTLTSLHERIVKGYANNQTLINELNTNFTGNLDKILKNIQLVEQRIDALSK